MVSVWFTRLHNHWEDCWSDSCPEDNHWHTSQGGKATNIHCQRSSCSQSAVSKHVNRMLSGRKRCTTNRENHSLMRIDKQNRFKTLGELHKEWTESGVKASRARVKEFGYSCHQRRLTWAKEKKNWTVTQWSKVLFSDESKFWENLWGIVKRKMRNKRPKNADELKVTVKETWASIPPQQCHKLITSMPRRIEAVIKAK